MGELTLILSPNRWVNWLGVYNTTKSKKLRPTLDVHVKTQKTKINMTEVLEYNDRLLSQFELLN
jgi:hypothetical protein